MKPIRRWWRVATAFALALCAIPAADALPSYARQTGSECAACHIGAYGPHLTPFGIRFKLGGYTDSDGKDGKIPLSGQVQISRIKPTLGSATTRVAEADVYLAGKLFPEVGAFVKVRNNADTLSSNYTGLDAMDVRWARESTLGERKLTWGVSVNNHPGVTDPIDALPAWGFGAAGPGRDPITLTPTGSLLNNWQGGLAHRVIGVTGYGLLDNHWYAELGTYRSLSQNTQHKLGDPATLPGKDFGDPGELGANTYWRLAWMHDMKTQFFSAGLIGLQAKLQPGPARSGPYDKYSDLGADVMYEYLGNREHIVQLRASYIREHRDYATTPPHPFFIPGIVALPTGNIRETALSATYFYRNTWGIFVGRSFLKGSEDPARFAAPPFNGKPDTNFTFIQPMWTVWGREDAQGPLGANLRLSLAWIRFDKFNGSSTAVFGPGSPDARDLNSFWINANLAF
jgi:hypothetical protein